MANDQPGMAGPGLHRGSNDAPWMAAPRPQWCFIEPELAAIRGEAQALRGTTSLDIPVESFVGSE
ncbi:MAG: hypothetical protein DHS20C11_13930 [Lysobacteraceae bacterium]|nr:MAG: hypothetical protein DHS20C11_13930 [Xanthomonadaceae bacterium]